MSSSINLHCDHEDCEAVFDVFTTADAEGAAFALRYAEAEGWSIVYRAGSELTYCAEHQRDAEATTSEILDALPAVYGTIDSSDPLAQLEGFDSASGEVRPDERTRAEWEALNTANVVEFKPRQGRKGAR